MEYQLGHTFQWIKGDYLYEIEKLVEVTENKLIFESGRSIFKEVSKEFLLDEEAIFIGEYGNKLNSVTENVTQEVIQNSNKVNETLKETKQEVNSPLTFFFNKVKTKSSYTYSVNVDLPDLDKISSILELLELSESELDDAVDFIMNNLVEQEVIKQIRNSIKEKISSNEST